MNKKVFWLIFIAFIAILSFLLFLIAMNKETDNINKSIPVSNINIDKNSAVNKNNDLTKKKFDVFKPQDKRNKEQRKRSEPILEYHSQEDAPLLM